MLYIGYMYETASGNTMKKLVICKDEKEYKQMKEKIVEYGMEVIEFAQIIKASSILAVSGK